MATLQSRYFKNDPRLQSAAEKGPPLARGETSSGVALMQAGLLDLGYKMPRSVRPDKSTDGVFGEESDRVVREFQAAEHLKADGMAGPRTLGRLDELLLGRTPPIPPRPRKLRRPRPPVPPAPPPVPPPVPPKPAPAPIVIEDPHYKIGSDDPPLGHDPGAGPWGSKPATFQSHLLKGTILQICYGPALAYPGINATKHMLHYFGNTGRDYTINLEDMVRSVAEARSALVSEFRHAQRFIHKLPVGQHAFVAKDTHSAYNSKGESADWFFAIGGYTFWGKGTVRITQAHAMGPRSYEVQFQFKFYDRYNWDGGKKVTIGGIEVTDEAMGEFHRQGLAKEFDCYGSITRTLFWIGETNVPSDEAIQRGSH